MKRLGIIVATALVVLTLSRLLLPASGSLRCDLADVPCPPLSALEELTRRFLSPGTIVLAGLVTALVALLTRRKKSLWRKSPR